jgi:hypothetical protein
VARDPLPGRDATRQVLALPFRRLLWLAPCGELVRRAAAVCDDDERADRDQEPDDEHHEGQEETSGRIHGWRE